MERGVTTLYNNAPFMAKLKKNHGQPNLSYWASTIKSTTIKNVEANKV